MQEVFRVSMMLDFYGQLITKRQYEIMDMYYNGDYSLGEIAESLSISRQGVYDNIKKGQALLDRFEKRLRLVERHLRYRRESEQILQRFDKIAGSVEDDSIKAGLMKLREELSSFISKSI